MCERAIKLQPYIDEWLLGEIRLKYSAYPSTSSTAEADYKDLKKLQLVPAEWEHLKAVTRMLKNFKSATNALSGSLKPQSQTIWMMYDGLFNFLEDMIDTIGEDENNNEDIQWPEVVRSAAAKGRAKLRKYYARTGGPQGFLYNCATILDPNTKLTLYDVSYHSLLSHLRTNGLKGTVMGTAR